MSDNWIVQNLENALETWNEKLSEIWQLITQSPESFKGGTIWNVIVNIILSLVKVYLLPLLVTEIPLAENLISDNVLLVSSSVKLYFFVSGLYFSV